MRTDSHVALTVLAAVVIVASGLAVPAAANGTTPVCPVCGGAGTTAWEDTSHPPPDTSSLTVDVHENGSATWTATLRWRDADGAPAPDDEDAVEELTRETLADSRFVPPAEAVRADVAADDRATVRWRTPNVVEYRFGEGVVTLFRTTGGADQPHLNAEQLVVRVPDGTVITNDPARGTVSEDRTELRQTGPGRIEDFYVAFGEEPGAATTTLVIWSVVWPRAAGNALVVLGPAALVLAVGLGALYAVSRRREGSPDDRTVKFYGGLGVGLGALLVGGIVVAEPGGDPLVWAAAAVGALLGLAGFGYLAAGGERRRAAGVAALVYLVAVGPFLAREWPLVDLHPLYRFAAMGGLLAFCAAVVLLGSPAYLVGDALARRRAPGPDRG
jgi:hypothetical protein